MRRLWSSWARDRRASFAPVAALGMTVLVGSAALAVDLGSLYLEKRRLQAANDLAAIAAAADLVRPLDAAAATLARNGLGRDAIASLETGRYDADPALAPQARFTPLPGGAAETNAVRLGLRRSVPLFFGRIFEAQAADGDGGVVVASRAVAARPREAAFAIGSRLASLDGGLLNAVLGGLFGTTVSLSVMDYQALAGAKVDLPSFLDGLASRLKLQAGTYDALLDRPVRTSDVLAALGDAARADRSFGAGAAAALGRLALAKAGSADTLPLRGVIDLGSLDGKTFGGAGAAVALSAFDLLNAVAQAANGSRQVQVSLAASLPSGLAAATLDLAIGQRPARTGFVTVGMRGATVTTAQTRLVLKVRLLGAPPLGGVTVPLLLDLARSTATLKAVTCGGAGGNAVTLAVQPGAADLWLGTPSPSDLADLTTVPDPAAATLVQVAGLATVTGRGRASLQNLAPVAVSFTDAEIAQGTKKRTGTTDYVASLLASLTRNLDLRVTTAGVGLTVDARAATLATLNAAAPAIDALLTNVLSTLGVGIGQADTWIAGVRCSSTALVN